MFVVIIKLKSHFSCHSYRLASAINTHETTANSDWPITDPRMRNKTFTIEVR